MKRAFVVLLLLALTVTLIPASFASEGPDGSRYVILFNGNAVPDGLEASVADAGGQLVRAMPQVGIAIAVSSDASFAAAMGSAAKVMMVGQVPTWTLPETVGFAAPADAPTAADDLYNAGMVWGVDRVHAPAAWAEGYTGSHDTVVAVIDTGIAWNHPDLGPNVIDAACYTSAGSVQGFDTTSAICNPYPSLSDHGTHVAGTVAAAFDGGRVVGVGPNLGLAGYNTFEEIEGCGVCSYSDSRWAAMIDAADKGYDVISMSLGGYGQFGGPETNELAAHVAAEKRITDYVIKAGVTPVASAGNGGLDLNGTIIHVPGDVPGIINVGATGIQPVPRYPYPDSYDIRAFYGNYGAPLTLSAPGGDCGQIDTCDANRPPNWFEYLILSTIVDADPACAETASCDVWYGWKGGTSMATPHVSGAAGVLKDANPKLSPHQVTTILKQTAESLGDRQQFGHGMVDVYGAVTK